MPTISLSMDPDLGQLRKKARELRLSCGGCAKPSEDQLAGLGAPLPEPASPDGFVAAVLAGEAASSGQPIRQPSRPPDEDPAGLGPAIGSPGADRPLEPFTQA